MESLAIYFHDGIRDFNEEDTLGIIHQPMFLTWHNISDMTSLDLNINDVKHDQISKPKSLLLIHLECSDTTCLGTDEPIDIIPNSITSTHFEKIP